LVEFSLKFYSLGRAQRPEIHDRVSGVDNLGLYRRRYLYPRRRVRDRRWDL
jgi:hypothetical protein